MTIRGQDNKVLRNAAGEVLSDVAGSSGLNLKIDSDLQQPNRILKDSSGLVSQITDKAQNLPVVVVGSDNALYNYGGYYECSTSRYNVDDDEITTGHTLYFHISNNDHSAEATTGIFYQKGNLIIRQKANANNLEIVVNSVVVIDYTYTHSQDYFYAVYFDGTNCYLVENGIVKAKSSYSGLNATGTTELWGDGTNYFKGNCYSIRRWDKDIFGIDGKIITDNVGYINSDFTYYKRYNNPNIVTYLNSRYLKDAVINSSDEITSIKDEQGNVWVDAGTNPVKLTNKGLLFNQSYLHRTGFEIETNNFFIGLWVNNDNTTDANIYQNSGITIDKSLGNYRINTNVIGSIITGKNQYVWACRISGVLYYGIDGVRLGSVADTTNYTLSNSILGSNSFQGYIDELLPEIDGTLLTSIGTGKIFGPNELFARRSLDNKLDLPILDLRSTNINKDASNNVQTWYDTYKPSLRSARDNGSNVVENGDGLDFAGNVNAEMLVNLPNLSLSDFFIGFWAKFKSDPLSRLMVTFGCYASGSPSFYLQVASSGELGISLQGSTPITEGVLAIDPDLTTWNYLSIEKVGSSIYFCKNGILSGVKTSSLDLKTNGNILAIGNIGGVQDFNEFDGKIDDVQILPYYFNNYINKSIGEEVFKKPKRSSE